MKRYDRRTFLKLSGASALLAGCGGTESSSGSAAGQSVGSIRNADSSQNTPALTTPKARITDQYTLEKNVSGVWGEEAVQYISVHVPQMECDSPNAVSLNKDLNAIYAADFREYETCEEAGQPGDEYPQIGVNWDDWWYGDCISLVVRSRYDGTAPWRYSGWCFDFATGRQITTARCCSAWVWTRTKCRRRCSGRPCRPLTGRWRRARITRACVSAESFRKCGCHCR